MNTALLMLSLMLFSSPANATESCLTDDAYKLIVTGEFEEVQPAPQIRCSTSTESSGIAYPYLQCIAEYDVIEDKTQTRYLFHIENIVYLNEELATNIGKIMHADGTEEIMLEQIMISAGPGYDGKKAEVKLFEQNDLKDFRLGPEHCDTYKTLN